MYKNISHKIFLSSDYSYMAEGVFDAGSNGFCAIGGRLSLRQIILLVTDWTPIDTFTSLHSTIRGPRSPPAI